jgi:transcriptional regulator with XRE-family HTH domain
MLIEILLSHLDDGTLTPKTLAHAAGVSASTVSHWKHRDSEPSRDAIKNMIRRLPAEIAQEVLAAHTGGSATIEPDTNTDVNGDGTTDVDDLLDVMAEVARCGGSVQAQARRATRDGFISPTESAALCRLLMDQQRRGRLAQLITQALDRRRAERRKARPLALAPAV